MRISSAGLRAGLLLAAAPVHAAQAPILPGSPPGPSEIVVRGSRVRPSAWREAVTGHVVLVSDGPEAELVRLSRNLERLHFLLSGLLGRGAGADDTLRLQVTLMGDVATFQAMELSNKRWQQGPFNELFDLSRYYDPRADGAVMATTRVDQRIAIEHSQANAMRLSGVLMDLGASAVTNPAGPLIGTAAFGDVTGPGGGIDFGQKAIDVSAESLLYAGYAQHFLLTYFPAAYPRWYLDGFGQIFASFAVRGDDRIEFGRVPQGTSAVLGEFGPFPLRKVLDDSYLHMDPGYTRWTPIHAWLLTHFLFFSDARRPQLRRYLALRAQGADPATAAAAFGDPTVLTRELRAYFDARKSAERIIYPAAAIDQPAVRRLNEGEAAFIQGRLELGSRVLIPPAPAPDTDPQRAKTLTRVRDAALAARERWLVRLRRDAARWPRELTAQLLLTEAECRSGEPDRCLAAARAAAAIAPDDTQAMTWTGLALAEQAVADPSAERAGRLAEARRLLAMANHRDTEAVEPLLAYYQSFVLAGEPPSPAAVDGLQKAVLEVPDAPESRLSLAQGLVALGHPDRIRPVILPVAAGPYESPERSAAQALLATTPVPTPSPTTPPPRP